MAEDEVRGGGRWRPRRPRRAAIALGAVVVVVVVALAVWSRGRTEQPFVPVGRPAVEAWWQPWDPPAADAVVLHAAPDGSGDACTDSNPCSLVGARDRARALLPTLATDLVVQLRDGTYAVGDTLSFGAQDSGSGGHRVHWLAAPGASPVLSGGTRVTGWVESTDDPGTFEAEVPPGTRSRQLWVDDVRAQRARSEIDPEGWERTAGGFRGPDDALAAWPDLTDAEIVSFREWKALRCPIASVSGRDVTLAQPCWRNANAHDPYTMTNVTWIEGAAALLDEPGEWHLDPVAGRVRYRPRPGEDLATAEVVLGTTETLLWVQGTPDEPVHDLSFSGLTFAHDTWLGPSTAIGYPVLQAGWFSKGELVPPDERDLGRTPGAVTVGDAQRIRFEGNTFTHLGAAGVDLASGSRSIGVVGNTFTDVASHGISAGETFIGAHAPDDPRAELRELDLRENVVDHVGIDYPDAVGIIVTYGARVSIVHNDVAHLPYTGISLGWGWGTDSYARDNVVRGNHVWDVMRVLRDGGAIYTLSSQPGSVIDENHVTDVEGPFGALYLDEGTADFVVAANVVERAPRWLHIWTTSITRNIVVDNVSDTDEAHDGGTANVVTNNIEDRDDWPPQADAVIAAAGAPR